MTLREGLTEPEIVEFLAGGLRGLPPRKPWSGENPAHPAQVVSRIVLHWRRNLIGRPAIVGYSEAVGSVRESTIVWDAHGTSGRARGPAFKAAPSWSVMLRNHS